MVMEELPMVVVESSAGPMGLCVGLMLDRCWTDAGLRVGSMRPMGLPLIRSMFFLLLLGALSRAEPMTSCARLMGPIGPTLICSIFILLSDAWLRTGPMELRVGSMGAIRPTLIRTIFLLLLRALGRVLNRWDRL